MFGSSEEPFHLPRVTGPYAPGAVDIHVNYGQDGIFFRFYYPTEKDPNNTDYTRWIPFIPNDDYIRGIASVIMLNPIFFKLLIWKSGKPLVPLLYGEKPYLPAADDSKIKCIIMSHGLGAYRGFYNTCIMELVSRGYYVLSIEHRDESSCYTYYYDSIKEAQTDSKTSILFRKVELGKEHYAVRNKQVNYRSQECSKALKFLQDLNAGSINPSDVFIEPFSNSPIDFNLKDFTSMIDLHNISIMGHSFGGATALLTLSKHPNELKCGILLDPWMFSLKDEGLLSETIKQPLIFINTQTFHVAANVKALEGFLHHSMQTILHTTHEHQTDSVVTIGSWMNWFMRKIHPMKALKINNYLILRFLKKSLDQNGKEENKEVGLEENASNEVDNEDYDEYLNKQAVNIAVGLPKPWA